MVAYSGQQHQKHTIVFPKLPVLLFRSLEVIEMAAAGPLEWSMRVLPVPFHYNMQLSRGFVNLNELGRGVMRLVLLLEGSC